MLAGFKKFIVQGNVVDLAVGIAIGAAFGALVKAFTDAFITPLVAVVTGGGSTGGTFTISEQVFNYGSFIGAIVTFVITAMVIYFVVVVPVNTMKDRRSKTVGEPEDPSNEEKMVALLEQIAAAKQ